MPERQNDANAFHPYAAVSPSEDLQGVPAAVQAPNLVHAIGLDGRVLGVLRSFPGMGSETLHGLPKAEDRLGYPINNVEYVAYAAVKKGTSKHVLRGLVMLGDNQAGTGKALYFVYWDTEAGVGNAVVLENFEQWADFKPTSFDEYAVTYLGRYIYFVNSGSSTSNVDSFVDAEPPYNKAYWWDFKINSWDRYVSGFTQRFLGLLPSRLLRTKVNEDHPTDGTLNSDDAMETQIYGTSTFDLPVGDYTYAAEVVSKKHKLRSHIRFHTKRATAAPNSSLQWGIDRTHLPTDNGVIKQQVRATATLESVLANWGIGHCDGFRLWKTQKNDSEVEAGKYTPVQHLYLVEDYRERGVAGSGSSPNEWDFRFDPEGTAETTNSKNAAYFVDEGLVTQEQYDPFFHEFGPAPRMKRLLGFDGMLIGVTDHKEPTALGSGGVVQDYPEEIVWSSVATDEPENFPVDNRMPLDDASETVMDLVKGGSTAWAVTNMGAYRIARAGSALSIIKALHPTGAVSRFGQVAVNNTLYIVTRSGVKAVDGNTLQVNDLKRLNRLIYDDAEWAKSLEGVRVGYDSYAGALVLLNTTKKEAVLVWESTGAITRLSDCPWTFLVSGPDAKTQGGHRCYLITSDGKVACIDAYRQAGKRTMYGANAGDTVNGTFTAGTTATSLLDSTANFSTNAVGFKVYILSGDRAGEVATITARPSTTELTVTGLSGAPATGDRYSIAPVYHRVTFSQLPGPSGVDPFVAKITSAMSVAFTKLGGESGPGNTNGQVTVGMRTETSILASDTFKTNLVPDKCVGRVNVRNIRMYPFIEMAGSNLDVEIQGLLVKGTDTMSEAQSRQG